MIKFNRLIIILIHFYSNEESNCATEKKYIVCEPQLLMLFSHCPACHNQSDISKTIVGSMVQIIQTCTFCWYSYKWRSQNTVNDIPACNILISAAILSSGLLPRKALRFFDFLNCQRISSTTFFNHQNHFLFPVIDNIWKKQQSEMIAHLKSLKKDLTLGGDGRCDSPGFCAKYGSYAVMDLAHNQVLDIQLIQVIKYI